MKKYHFREVKTCTNIFNQNQFYGKNLAFQM